MYDVHITHTQYPSTARWTEYARSFDEVVEQVERIRTAYFQTQDILVDGQYLTQHMHIHISGEF